MFPISSRVSCDSVIVSVLQEAKHIQASVAAAAAATVVGITQGEALMKEWYVIWGGTIVSQGPTRSILGGLIIIVIIRLNASQCEERERQKREREKVFGCLWAVQRLELTPPWLRQKLLQQQAETDWKSRNACDDNGDEAARTRTDGKCLRMRWTSANTKAHIRGETVSCFKPPI